MTNTESQVSGEWEYLDDGARMVRRDFDEKLGRKLVVASLRPRDAVDLLNQQARELSSLRETVGRYEVAIRAQGKCVHCQGTGKPNCVTCHNYQGCICKPGEGRYAEHCWNCKGSGLNKWAVEALTSPEEVK